MNFWLLSTYLSVVQSAIISNHGNSLIKDGIVTNGSPSPTSPPVTSPPVTLPPITLPPVTLPPITLPTVLPTLSSSTLAPSTTAFPLIDPRFGNQIPIKVINDEPIKFGDNESAFKTKTNTSHKRNKRQTNCGCYSTCPNTNGAGLIDPRIIFPPNGTQDCASGLKYCCPTSAPQVSCGSRLQISIIYPTTSGQAKYGDYPWMVGILANDNTYVGGGVLIDSQNVLTVAHRIINFTNGAGLKIRLGEWDYSGNYEQYPYKDFAISKVSIHESYNPSTLQNDVAVLKLNSAITADTPGVVPICMPTNTQNFDGQRCWVAGWGKDNFTANGYQTVLKAVDVPILAAASCETTLRTTRLGAAYVLDKAAFICAGGELNKDACTGDGGSGLVCETTTGRWTLAGLVAWGLGCAAQGVPAAYVNVANYIPWITGKQAAP